MKILPCPFCGSEAETNPVYGADMTSCTDEGCICWPNPRPVAEWNHRTYPPEVKAVIDAAKYLIRTDRDENYSATDEEQAYFALEYAVLAYKEMEKENETQNA